MNYLKEALTEKLLHVVVPGNLVEGQTVVAHEFHGFRRGVF